MLSGDNPENVTEPVPPDVVIVVSPKDPSTPVPVRVVVKLNVSSPPIETFVIFSDASLLSVNVHSVVFPAATVIPE